MIGEAGIGKSRLLYDLRGWLELLDEPIRLLEGRALPAGRGVALGLIRDVIARRFEIRDSDSPIEVERKLRDGFGSSFASAETSTRCRAGSDSGMTHTRDDRIRAPRGPRTSDA